MPMNALLLMDEYTSKPLSVSVSISLKLFHSQNIPSPHIIIGTYLVLLAKNVLMRSWHPPIVHLSSVLLLTANRGNKNPPVIALTLATLQGLAAYAQPRSVAKVSVITGSFVPSVCGDLNNDHRRHRRFRGTSMACVFCIETYSLIAVSYRAPSISCYCLR